MADSIKSKVIEVVASFKDLFSGPAKPAADAAAKIGTEVETAGKKAQESQKHFAGLASVLGGLKSAIGGVLDVMFSFKGLITGIVSGLVLERFVHSLVETAESLKQVGIESRRTGIAVGDIARLAEVAKDFNISLPNVSRGVLEFQKRLEGVRGVTADVNLSLQKIGIDPLFARQTKDIGGLLQAVSAGLEDIGDEGQKLAVLNALFGQFSGAFRVLLDDSKEFAASFARSGDQTRLLTQQQIEKAQELSRANDQLRTALRGIRVAFLEAFGPAAIEILKLFTNAVNTLGDVARGAANALRAMSIGASIDPSDQSEAAERLRQGGEKAKALLADIIGEAINLFIQGAYQVGKTIALTFIDVLKSALITIAGPLGRVIRDAIAPTIRAAGIGFEFTPQTQLKQQESLLKTSAETIDQQRARISELEDALDKTTADDLSELKQSLASARADLAISEKAIADSGGVDAIKKRIEVLKKLIAENEAAETAAASESIGGAIARMPERLAEAKKALEPVVARLQAMKTELFEFRKEADEFREKQKKAAEEGRPIAPAEIEAATRAQEQRAAALAAEVKRIRLSLDEVRARAAGRPDEVAKLRLELDLVQQRVDLEVKLQSLGDSPQAVEEARKLREQFDEVARLQTTKVNADIAAAKVLRDNADAQVEFNRALERYRDMVQAGIPVTAKQREELKALARESIASSKSAEKSIDELIAELEKDPDMDGTVRELRRVQREIVATRKEAQNLLGPQTFGEGFTAGLQAFADKFQEVAAVGRQFAQDLGSALQSGIGSVIDSLVEGTKTWGDAFRDAAVKILESIAEIILKLLAMQAVVFVLRALGVVQPLATGGEVTGIQALAMGGTIRSPGQLVPRGNARPGILGFPDGGVIPGAPAPEGVDTVLIAAQPEEWMIRRSSAKYYGHEIMSAINNQLVPRSAFAGIETMRGAFEASGGAAPHPGMQRLAAGGAVKDVPSTAAPGGAGAPPLAIVEANDRTMESLLAGGKNAMLRFMGENRGKF